MTAKPKPQVDEQHNACICPKCNGSGVFATIVLDGVPYSPTGTTCWRCNGKGWQIKWKRGARKEFWANVKPVTFDYNGKPVQE